MSGGAEPAGRVCLGAIAGAFGVSGEVRLKSFCAAPLDIAAYGPLESEDGTRRFVLTQLRAIKGGLAARASGVGDRGQAEALRGTRLYVPRTALPDPGDDEFYHADLIGLTVIGPEGQALGRVKAVHDHGAGDLLEVASPAHPSGVLLPFTHRAVPRVDLATGRIFADPPEGLFD